VANYCLNMNKEIDMIAHSCGLRHAREFRREHVRIVQAERPEHRAQHALSLSAGAIGVKRDGRPGRPQHACYFFNVTPTRLSPPS
jgi:hypothetical protein